MRITFRRAATLASLLSLVVVGGADCAPPVDDGGVSVDDVDGGSVPAFDAGPDFLSEGDVCVLDQPACPDDTMCVPRPLGGSFGVCRRQCGTSNGTTAVEDPAACGTNESCQAILDDGAQIVAVACFPVVDERDEICFAAFDVDACDREGIAAVHGVSASQVSCAVTNGDESGPLFCKIECEIGFDDECPVAEACFPDATGILYVELDDDEDYVYCGQHTDCDLDNGYVCTPTDEGDICAKSQGTCATPAPLWGGGALTPEHECNVVDKHQACDDRALRSTEGGATIECDALLGTPVCIAYCTYPGFDYDDNGVIEEWEAEEIGACPVDMVCSGVLAIGIDTTKPCACNEGATCPASCGIDSTEVCADGFCRAVFKTCVDPELTDLAPNDAGVDAGGVDADAGVLDGGTNDTGFNDGGTTDAGVSDAGASDAG